MAAKGKPIRAADTDQAPAIPVELIYFDQLPDSAHVRLPVVTGLLGCSSSAVWRNVKQSNLPAPIKLTPNITAWNVGALRRHLALRVQA